MDSDENEVTSFCFTSTFKALTNDQVKQMEIQNKRLVPMFKASKLEIDAKKNWDLFYKRNETRFFRDRHWTTREFKELLSDSTRALQCTKTLLEVGCGVGNLIFPLIEENKNDYFIYACDLSPRAVEFVKSNPLYKEECVKAFQTDITTNEIYDNISPGSLDIITLIFVLSAIHPDKFNACLQNLYELLTPGGVVLFRDYGLHDMAQLRFKPGSKIAENFYMRQDGTRAYYFSDAFVSELFTSAGFSVITNSYVHRRTINQKENIDVPRIFVQGKFTKPLTN